MLCSNGGNMDGYQLGVPLVVDNDWKFFENCGAGCDAGCDFDEPDPDIITKPCCANGCCKTCAAIGGDAPYLVPKSLACGRTRLRGEMFESLLDGLTELPGRGDHNIVCVRAGGVANLMFGDIDCDGYELNVIMDIPIEIIMVDCCGFIYAVKSTIPGMLVHIPLGFKASHIADGSSFLYVKVKVRMCDQVMVPEGMTSAYIYLNVLVEACAQKFIPYGLVGEPCNRMGAYTCN